MKNYFMSLFIVSLSPWPLILSIILMMFSINFILMMNMLNFSFFILNFILVLMSMFFWWNDVVSESSKKGFHNNYLMSILMNSMILFIVSEVFFFISFFWTFFHSMFSPDIMIGSIWPSFGVNSINYMNLPLMNSILLLSSGSTVTWSHFMILSNKMNNCKLSMMITFILGMIFLFFQMYEYSISSFCFSDSIFGSIFFISTGFHGIHVLIGTLFLIIVFIRLNLNHFSSNHLLGMEFSIWYWHFVDVVWLYLYMVVYWLGS